MSLIMAKTKHETEKKKSVTKSLADHFLTAFDSTLRLFALRRASTSLSKSNSTPFFFNSSTHFLNSFASSFSLSNNFSRCDSTSDLYLTAQMIPKEDRRAQSEGIHDLLHALEEAETEEEEEAWKRRSREMEWKRKKKM